MATSLSAVGSGDLTNAAWLRPHQSVGTCRQGQLVQPAELWARPKDLRSQPVLSLDCS